MPFAEIEKIKYASPQVGADQVSISTRRLPENRGAGRRYPIVRLGRGVLGRVGWFRDCFVRAYWGTGADLGKLRLARSQSGYALRPNKVGTMATVHISALPEGYDRSRDLSHLLVKWRVIDSTRDDPVFVEIDLPKGLVTDPSADAALMERAGR